MSFGFGFAHPHWKTLSGGFTPASLFIGGEQGAWYDPSDYSTLFQDANGVTPVSTLEQPVRLMLDKSKMPAGTQPWSLGPDLLGGAGSFDSASGWTLSAGISISAGQLVSASSTNGAAAYTLSSVSAGKVYVVTISQTAYTSGSPFMTIGQGANSALGAAFFGRRSFVLVAGSADSVFRMYSGQIGVGGSQVYDSVTIQEVIYDWSWLGADQLTGRGSFSNPSDWTTPVAGASVSGGALVFDGVTSIAAGVQVATPAVALSLAAGKTYRVTYSIVVGTTNPVSVGLTTGGILGTPQTAVGTYTEILAPTSTASIQVLSRGSVGIRTGSIDNITVQEIPGNPARAPSDTTRPILSARYNLLQRTEEFDNAAWSKVNGSVTANAAAGPFGGSSADKFTPNTTAAVQHRVDCTVTSVAGSQRLSCYIKADGYSFASLRIGASGATFNVGNGTLGTAVSASTTRTIESVGSGWYLCTIVVTNAAANDTGRINVEASGGDLGGSFAGDGTSGILVWGADLRVTNDALNQPAYQRVGDGSAGVFDYDATGFLPYLQFDGLDDSMSTVGSIDFSATDKMTVFAGLTKLSDAATGMLTELSSASNTGTFNITAPDGASATLGFALRGSAASSTYYVPTGLAAPITRTIAVAYDIAGLTRATEIFPYLNGALTQAGGGGLAEAGTGNYGNYPLFIGARNSSSLWFSGRLYSLIVRGAQSDAGQIAATEAWVNQKTGAY